MTTDNRRNPSSRAAPGQFRVAVAILVLGMPLRLLAAAPACGTEPVTAADAKDVVATVTDHVASAHVGSLGGMAPLLQERMGALHDSINGPMQAAELALAINHALAAAGDAHLRLKLDPQAENECTYLPIELIWSEHGLLAGDGSAVPTGSRVLSIAGHSLDALDALARQSIPHENPYWARSEFARLLPRKDMLVALGMIDPEGKVEIAYESPKQEAAAVRLLPDRARPEPRPWVGFRVFPEASTGLFWLDRCEVNETFNDALASFLSEVQRLKLRKVAIDLRGNPGGDSAVALAILTALNLPPQRGFSVEVRVSPELHSTVPVFAPENMSVVLQSIGHPAIPADASHYLLPGDLVLAQLSQRLPAHPPVAEKAQAALFLLTDGGTFSSATLFAALVRDNALGTLVGEPTGNAASFNASEIRLNLPKLPYFLNLSTARLERPDPGAGPASTILPDALASPTPASLSEDQDLALEFVLAR